MNVKKYFVAAFAALMTCAAQADEGMWLLQLLKEQNSIELMKKQPPLRICLHPAAQQRGA